jgi:DHA3 family macrolide efflux protein-like MFS transporter
MQTHWKKNTALFLTGQALTLFGSMVVQYAILWHITLKTGSGSMMSVFAIAGFLPMFFISPFAGVWADRFNKKYIINLADGGIALVSLIVALFLWCAIDHTGVLLACAIVRSLGQGVQLPAVGAFIPQLVPEEKLTRVNGIQSSIQSISMLAAPVASGALMSIAPLESLFLVDVITAAVGISILALCVKAPAGPAAPAEHAGGDYFRDLKEGLIYIARHGWILRLILFSVAFFIAISPAAFLTPLQVTRNFSPEVWRLTSIEVVFLGGMFAGGLIISAWGGFKNRVHTMALSTALCGMEALALGLEPRFWSYLIIMAAMGLTMPLYTTPSMVLLQTKVEPSYIGRVLSVFNMVSSIMMPSGMLLFGPLADIVSIDRILIVTGAFIVILALPFAASKSLREAGKTP